LKHARLDLEAAQRALARHAGLVVLAALAALALAAGACGRRIALPDEPTPPNVNGEVAYVVKYTWTGVPPIYDLVVTSNQVLFAVVDSNHVSTYFSDTATLRENPTFRLVDPVILPRDTTSGAPLDTLLAPVRVCEGKGNTLWVAYLQRLVAGVRTNWSVLVEFNASESPVRPSGFSVKDPGIRKFGGITADADSGYVYVADTAANTITKYSPTKLGGRRVTVLATEGNGDHFVREPHGIRWFQDSLLVADTGKSWIQVIAADKPGTGRGQVSGPAASPLQIAGPTGVCVDSKGFYYVADTGHGRVLKITRRGVIKLNVTESDDQHALEPMAFTANTTMVWIPDPATGRLTVYQINTAVEGLP
jgi:hypothetical protein